MTLNKGLLTATVLYFGLCGAPFAQELVKASNEMITHLEIAKPEACRQVPVNEKTQCEQLFADTIQAIRNKVAHFTKGDIPTARHWKQIQDANIAEVRRRYGHLRMSTAIGASLVK